MDLHQIEIFCTLIRLRSFSRTAEALYLTQPTVSGHIKNLETELGVRLLDRLGKRIIPTAEGDILFRHGVKLLEQRELALQEIQQVSGAMSGRLNIGGSTIPGAYILPSLIGAFRTTYPAVAIRLSIEDTANITAAVLSGELSIGIVGASVSDPAIETHSFLKDELVVAVPADHPWARRKSVPLEALKDQPFLLREPGSGTLKIMESRLDKAGLALSELRVVAVVGSSDAVRQSVKAGLGVSILSIRAVQDDIEAGRLAALRIAGVKMERHFSVILLKGRHRSPLVKAFLDFLMHNAGRAGQFRTSA